MAFSSPGLLTSWLGGGKRKPGAVFRSCERELDRAESHLRSEVRMLEREIDRLMQKINESVTQGKQREANHFAQEVVTKRRQKDQLYQTQSMICLYKRKVSLRRATAQQHETFRNLTLAIIKSNRTISAAHTVAICEAYNRQEEIMELKQEIMDDQASELWSDDVGENDDDETAKKIVERVQDQISMKVTEQMSTADAAVYQARGVGRPHVSAIEEPRALAADAAGAETTSARASETPPVAHDANAEFVDELQRRLDALGPTVRRQL